MVQRKLVASAHFLGRTSCLERIEGGLGTARLYAQYRLGFMVKDGETCVPKKTFCCQTGGAIIGD